MMDCVLASLVIVSAISGLRSVGNFLSDIPNHCFSIESVTILTVMLVFDQECVTLMAS